VSARLLQGGGVLHVTTEPVGSLPPLNLTRRGQIVKFSGTALVTHRLPVHIAQRMVDTATRVLRRDNAAYRGVEIDIRPVVCEEEQAPLGDGVSLLLMAHTSTGAVLASSGVGERGLPAETLATKAAESLLANLDAGGVVDEHMQDQLIIFMALAKGTSTIKTGPLTLHTRTCLYWAEYLAGAKVEVRLARDASVASWHTPEPSDTRDTVLIRIEGIGYQSRFRK
jgi:RNA 3'-terminal phosphate cyclase (ATP)